MEQKTPWPQSGTPFPPLPGGGTGPFPVRRPRKTVSVRFLVFTTIGALAVGGLIGFLLGLYSTEAGRKMLQWVVQDEQRADVTRPHSIDREGFSLQYPANWQIATEDDDYDPDTSFSIESPGSSVVMFFLGDCQIDTESAVQTQVAAYQKRMTGVTVTPFGHYGKYEGRGAQLEGRILGIPMKVRAFATSRDGGSAIIVEQCPDEDAGRVRPGFDLIEESFLLKPSP